MVAVFCMNRGPIWERNVWALYRRILVNYLGKLAYNVLSYHQIATYSLRMRYIFVPTWKGCCYSYRVQNERTKMSQKVQKREFRNGWNKIHLLVLVSVYLRMLHWLASLFLIVVCFTCKCLVVSSCILRNCSCRTLVATLLTLCQKFLLYNNWMISFQIPTWFHLQLCFILQVNTPSFRQQPH